MYRNNELSRCFSTGKANATREDPVRRGDKKRQQSRSAAKSRRLTESEIFAQLIETLPTIDQQTIYQMDRIGALRLALTLCRVRRIGERFFSFNSDDADDERQVASGLVKSKLGRAIVEDATSQVSIDSCVDGFLMVVNKVGQLLFVTLGVSESIGFTQIDLVGRYLRDYVHADDWRELRDHLCTVGSGKPQSEQSERHSDVASKTFFRMKTALTPRGGRARKLTMAVYQPLQAFVMKPSIMCHGASFEGFDYDEGANAMAEMDEDIRLIHCIPFTLSSSRRSPSDSCPSITSRHDLDMRFRICDEALAHTLGFKNAKSFIGRSYYDLVHPDDVQLVARDVREMYRKCHSRTGYYRLLNRVGESVWVMSEMLLLVQNIRGVSQKSVVCAHQILSESENAVCPPRMVTQQRLKPVKEYEMDEGEYDYAPMDSFVDQSEDVKPKTEVLTPIPSNGSISSGGQSSQMINHIPISGQSVQHSPIGLAIDTSPTDQVINQTPIVDPNVVPLSQWPFSTRVRQDSYDSREKSRSLAPWIACDNEILMPLEDPDMPGLLPTYWDHWLCGNPIPNVPNTDCPKKEMDKTDPPTINANQSVLSNDVLPLDFADIFGMDIDDTNQFSIDDVECAFSQFDHTNSPRPVESGRPNPATSVSQPETNWASSSDFTVPMGDGSTARRRSFSMYPSKGHAASAKNTERRSRMDSKTIEAFEMEMLGDSPGSGSLASMDDGYPSNNPYLIRPRSRSFHHRSPADEQKINSIQNELYRETQRFLA